jgi:hypothetical protein
MNKSTILDWVEYAGKVVGWLASVVRTFPVKDGKGEIEKDGK